MRLSNSLAKKRFREILLAARPEKIVVHAGRVKTGSTFLQAALMHSPERLSEAGWLFPESLLQFGTLQSESRGLRTAGQPILFKMAKGQKIEKALVDGFRTEMAGRSGDKILFSAELLGRDPRENVLAELSDIFEGFDVEIFMYLRRPTDWVNSYYIERVSGGNERFSKPLETHLESFRAAAQVLPFAEQIGTWKTPPQLRFLSYDLGRKGPGGLLADFCAQVGLPELPEPEMTGINKSPSVTIVPGILTFNALTAGLNGVRYRALYAELLEKLEALDDAGRGTLLSDAAQEDILTSWARDNAGIVARGHMSQEGFEALTAGPPAARPQTDPVLQARIMQTVCDHVISNGINGFDAQPTVASVAQELLSRGKAGLRRSLKKRVGGLL